jgi:hypothetical protein
MESCVVTRYFDKIVPRLMKAEGLNKKRERDSAKSGKWQQVLSIQNKSRREK